MSILRIFAAAIIAAAAIAVSGLHAAPNFPTQG